MCGITGFFTDKFDRGTMQGIVQAMTNALHHRGPDHGDTWQDPDVNLALGHTRLSIIDLSPEGAQPMTSSSGRYIISYNGEIYNFQDLRRALPDHDFRGHSDTEVLLHSIETNGLEKTLTDINGMFAFALWDRRKHILHLVRDRMGKKPLYLGHIDGDFAFASELKALQAHPYFKPEVNREALSLYLQYGYIPAPHSIYKNIYTLPPGHMVSIPLGQDITLPDAMKPYWSHTAELHKARQKRSKQPEHAAIDAFEDLLSQCVQDRMISDVPLGAFLSGGIDSSIITALMQKSSHAPVKTYTIGFKEAGFDEAAYARDVAQHLGTDHHELYLDERDALEIIPQLPTIYDEPFADISALPTYLVSQFARRDVTVALSGDGGDEMLGGYNRHISGPALWARMKYLPPFLKRGAAGVIHGKTPGQWDCIIKNKPQAGIQMHKLAKALSANNKEELFEGFLRHWDMPPTPQPQDTTGPVFDDQLSFAENMMAHDVQFYLPHNILTKVDRASMVVSLECRAPLLDKRIYDYVWSLPESFKIRNRKGKWLLRQVLARHVPAGLFERPKQGFSMPVGLWLRGALRDWAEDLLDAKKLKEQGFLDEGVIRAVWNEHISDTADHGTKLWVILMFQAWQDRWR